MDHPIVRQAVLEDLEQLAPLFDAYRHFYGKPHDPELAADFLRARFAHNESVLFIAHDEDLALGFVQLYPAFSSVSCARTFILNDLFVVEQARRRGIASRLLDAALDYANRVGAVRVTLSTALDNDEATALYEAEGWERDEAFKVYHFALSG
ncbi:MAG: N-acetyltransferase family protein [Gammaproteobacteria bacterium]